MVPRIAAFAAPGKSEALVQTTVTLAPSIGPEEVDVEVECCGVCHSDIHMTDDDWGISSFPLVPGHEVVGRVKATGSGVKALEVGQRVGVGWHAGYCNTCELCQSGRHNLCRAAHGTIKGRSGGFAKVCRAQQAAVIPIPDGLRSETAAPLLCGGVTVFTPLYDYKIMPTSRVGVVGIGGLGHLALQFANKWGCEVTAFTSNPDAKAAEAKGFGAHHVVSSIDPAAIRAAGPLDLIIVTVSATDFSCSDYIHALGAEGRLHIVGAVGSPIAVELPPLLMMQRQLSASPVGGPATLKKMLEFAARHGIGAETQVFPFEEQAVNDTMKLVRESKARYRAVLKW